MRMKPTRLVVLALAPLLLPAIASQAVEDHGHIVAIEDMAFSPAHQTVTVGEALTWRHQDPGVFHTVTADDGSFDSNPGCSEQSTKRCMKDGGVFRHTFKKTGQFPYYSKLHGSRGGKGVSGVVVVVAEGESESESH